MWYVHSRRWFVVPTVPAVAVWTCKRGRVWNFYAWIWIGTWLRMGLWEQMVLQLAPEVGRDLRTIVGKS